MHEVNGLLELWQKLERLEADIQAGLAMAKEDPTSYGALQEELLAHFEQWTTAIQNLEIRHLLSGEYDKSSAILAIHSGAGGTESMDWAEMLFRMYKRWAEKQGYPIELLDYQPGVEAGMKSATFLLTGEFAYGYLKHEIGVHRLVRISPFDTNKRRHTSFASVFVFPEVEEDVAVEILEKDLKIDTYRSSGAGGQHVNTTDSAVRILHIPSGIVVQCQKERSQIKNRATAMKILRSALIQRELEKKQQAKQQQHAEKKDISFGSQIRSYVLHPYQLVKDHRTDWSENNPYDVLDGKLNAFIDAELRTL